MTDSAALKDQRDKFLAFAFSSADLLFEISPEGKIIFAIGAAKGITGIDSKDWVDKNWMDMFRPYDQPTIQSLMDNAKPGHRKGPQLFDLDEKITTQKGILTGIKMPDNDSFFATISFSSAISTHIAELSATSQNQGILNIDNFMLAAEESALKAKANGRNIKIAVFDFSPTEKDKERLGEDNWGAITTGLCDMLISNSIDGRAAGEIGDGRYSIVQEEHIDTQVIEEKLTAFSKTKDPEGLGLKIRSKSIEGNLDTIEERDISKAIVYSVREFERKGSDTEIESLNSGFQTYAESNKEKVEELKNFINRSDFKINFQPIINFHTDEADHYEMRCRFEHGNTQEWVMFGEDTGLAPSFDIAICDRAISHINYNANNTRTRFSINISGESINDANFFASLLDILEKNKSKNISERLMFEITESKHIKDVKRVGNYIAQLRAEGYIIALDDFEADEESIKLLKGLDVDTIKIDGKITTKVLTSQPDLALLKNLVKTCNDMNKTVIAKSVEDEKQLEILKELGIKFGQGFYYGDLTSKPEYTGKTK